MSDNPNSQNKGSDEMPEETFIGCVRTYTGRMFNIAYPDPKTVDVQDIAWALSNQNRYGGATVRPWSEAAHAMVCADILAHTFPEFRHLTKHALLIGAERAYLGSLTEPVRTTLSLTNAMRSAAHPIREAIFIGLGLSTDPLPAQEADALKSIKYMARIAEYRVLCERLPADMATTALINKYQHHGSVFSQYWTRLVA